jgi:hypothetical protein
MNELLKIAVEAHGGLDRWNRLNSVRANASVGGALWSEKGKPGALGDISIEARLHEQHMVTHLNGQGRRAVFTPTRVTLETETGNVLESRADPRRAFEGHTAATPWDDLDVFYFDSYALWTYLTIPFVYTTPGFVTEELAPWSENGEKWRALQVTFPATIASHTRLQTSYFGSDGLLRRHEYRVDVLGGASGLNYAEDYRTIDGIAVPYVRRVYTADENHQRVPEPVLVAIDLRDVVFT